MHALGHSSSLIRGAKAAGLWFAVLLCALQARAQQLYPYSISSSPQTIIPTTSGYATVLTPVTTANISFGLAQGYGFGYWTVNGVRQAGVTGAALTEVILPMTTNEVAVAHFLSPGDSTGTGVQDWYQLFWFGNTNYTAVSDPTGDGFTLADDILRGYSPVVANSTTNGGGILRLSDSTTFVPLPRPANEFTLSEVVSGVGLVTNNPQATLYTNGQAVTLSATPGFGYVFAGWSGGASGSQNPLVLTVLSNSTVTATFVSNSQPPSVVLTNLAGTNVVVSQTSVSLQASVSDLTPQDGLRVEFIADGTNLLGAVTAQPFVLTTTNLAARPQPYLLTAIAIDGSGLQGTSSPPLSLTITPPPPATHFSLSLPANAVVGAPFTGTVTALGAANGVAVGYGGTLNFTSTDGSAVLPGTATLLNGVGTFTFTLNTIGGQTITARDTVSPSIVGTSVPVTVATQHLGGGFYVANAGAGTVSRVATNGVVSTLPGAFNSPEGLAFDGAGNLFVANYGGTTISKVTPEGLVSTFASGLNHPQGLAFDNAGNLYVANYGGTTIAKITPGGAMTTFASGFNVPSGLAVDRFGNVYVANANLGTVSRVTPAGAVTPFASGFSGPVGLAFDTVGNLYVANAGAGTVSKVTTNGVVTTWAGGLSAPGGLAFDGAGNLYVANIGGNTVSMVSPNGMVTTFATGFNVPVGIAVQNPAVRLQILLPGETNAPNTIAGKTGIPNPEAPGVTFPVTVNAVDGNNVVVPVVTPVVALASSDTQAILPPNATLVNGTVIFSATLLAPGGQTLSATNIAAPSMQGTSAVVNVGGPAEPVGLYVANTGAGTVSMVVTNGAVTLLAAGFNSPEGLAFDRYGDLYVANYGGNTISRVGANGVAVEFAAGFNGPNGLAFDTTGNLYVANYLGNTVSRVTPGGVVSTFATGFYGPNALAFDSVGNLYVGNAYHGSVSRVTPGRQITTFVNNLGAPGGLAFDSAGNLYVADVAYGEVWKVTANGVASVFAGGFSEPEGLAFDGSGNLYVASIGNGMVSKVTPGGTVTTYASGFNTPVGLAIQNAAVRLQILLPGETNSPYTTTGKTGSPATQLTGAPFTVTVNAVDGNGVVVPGASPTVAISSSDTAAGLPANATLVNGSQTFTVTLNSGGAQTLTATDTAGSTPLGPNTSSVVEVGTGKATHFAVVLPGSVMGANSFNGTVTALDAFSIIVTGYTGTVRFTSTDPAAGLPGISTLTGGTGTFSFTFQNAGGQTVTATDTASSSITGTSGVVTVTVPPLGVGLYVASEGKSSISMVAANGVVTTLGSGFNGPEGVAFDRFGNLYVANYGNNTVSKVTSTGFITTYAIGFNAPQGMAFDSAGNLYVANYLGNTVSKVTTNGVVSIFATGFDGPDALAFDGAGNLYVGNAYQGSVSRVTPGGLVTAHLVGFGAPGGLAFDSVGNLYVADVAYNEVWKIDTNGVEALFASGFNEPAGLAFDGSGNLYVANIGNGIVSKVTPGGIMTTFASGFSTPVGLAIQNPAVRLQILLPGETSAPHTLAGKAGNPTAQAAGTPFNVTVNAVDANGVVVPGATPVVALSSSDGAAALPPHAPLVSGTRAFAVNLNSIGAQTLTASDTTPVNPLTSNTSSSVEVGTGMATHFKVVLPAAAGGASSFSGTVTALDSFGIIVSGYTGTVRFSSTDPAAGLPANATLSGGMGTFSFTLQTAGSQTVTAADTVNPSITGTSGVVMVTVPPFGVGLYVANEGLGTISAVAPNGAVTTLDSGLYGPEGLAFDSQGNLYVANYYDRDVAKVTSTGLITTYASGLNGPNGLAFDSAGNLFVANYLGNTVSKVTPNGVVSTFASGLSGPGGLAFDSAGNLYVANSYSASISKITPGGVSTAFIGQLATPEGLAFDKTGNLYVSSVANNEVWKVTTNGVATVFASGIATPGHLAFDGSGNLYVTSITGGTVSRVTPGGTVSTYASGFSSPVGLAIQNPAVRLQVLLPGETGAPYTASGKKGSPASQVAGTSLSVTVNAVDGNGVVVPSALPVVKLGSSDPAAVLPSNAALASGTRAFTITFNTAGSQIVSATDTAALNPLTANSSSSVTVAPAGTLAHARPPRSGGRVGSADNVGGSVASKPNGTPEEGFTLTVTAPGAVNSGAGSPVSLSISGPVGARLQILVSSDLSNPNGWTELTNITIASSPVSFADPSDVFPASRYYKVVQLP